MPTNFPTSLDDGTSLPTKVDGDTITAAEDNTTNTALKAIEAKVGVDSSAVTTSIDYKAANHAHTGTGSAALGGTPAPVLSTSAAAGNATTYLRTNDQLALFDATAPSTQAFSDAAAAGSAAFAARRDHKHAMPDGVRATNGGLETVNAVGNSGTSQTIALTAGNVQTYTINGNCTFTMPSGLTSGVAISFTAILTDSGGSHTVTFTGVKWNAATAPTFSTTTAYVDIFTFLTINGGTTWYGFVGGQHMA